MFEVRDEFGLKFVGEVNGEGFVFFFRKRSYFEIFGILLYFMVFGSYECVVRKDFLGRFI